jgi:tetratricopeptide (TPR) repeat protein
MLPKERNPLFVGRKVLLNRLFGMLCETNPHRVALYGMGGIGKTETALAYTYSYKDYYRSIFWINGINQASLLSGFQQIASIIGLETTGSSTEPAESVLAWLQGHENWLLVIDNLDDISQISGYLQRIEGQGHTLITTRNPDTKGIPAPGVEVGLLESDEAVELLFLHLRTSAVDVERPAFRSEAQAIVRELGFLPLAIEQSGAYIRETGKSLESYLPLYRKHRRGLHQWVPTGNFSYPYSVATTWKIAVKSDSEEALLRLFAFLNPDNILLEFLEAGANGLDWVLQCVVTDKIALSAALTTLWQFSLIKLFEEGSVIIHRLLQQTIQDSMTDNELGAQWEQIIGLCHQAFPRETNESTRYLCRRYQDQVLIPLLACPEIKSEILGQCLNRVAFFLNEDGKFQQAAILAEKACKIQIEMAGEYDPATLTSMATLAYAHHGQGRLVEAVGMYERVVKGRKLVIGEEHPDTLTAENDLASVYSDQGRLIEALSLMEKVMEAGKRTLGEEHPDLLRAMSNLASVYSDQGRLTEAVLLMERVLEARKRMLGGEHPDSLRVMSNLASVYSDQGLLNEELELQKTALWASKRVLGEEHPDTLTLMSNLARTYRDQGQPDASVALNEKVSNTMKFVLGARHPATLSAMSNLASTYRALRRLDEALELEGSVLEATKAVLGEEHPATVTSMSNLALTYQHQERWDEAVILGEVVVETRRKILGEQHPDTIQSMADLSSAYRAQGRWHDAVVMDEMVLKTSETVFGKHHLITLKFMAKLASSYWVQGRREMALWLQEEVLKTRTSVLGEHHPDTLNAMLDVASSYRGVERWDSADRMYRNVLEARRATLGVQHPDTLAVFAERKAFRSDARTAKGTGLEKAVINWMAGEDTEDATESDNEGDTKSLLSTSDTVPTRYSYVLPLSNTH